VGSPEEGLRANEDVAQHLILLRSGEDKDQELVQLFKQRFSSPRHLVLVFVARKNTCDFVANMLNRVGIRASAMHSDRTQVSVLQYRYHYISNNAATAEVWVFLITMNSGVTIPTVLH
jgi:superfamily II DNA/RNA helicase